MSRDGKTFRMEFADELTAARVRDFIARLVLGPAAELNFDGAELPDDVDKTAIRDACVRAGFLEKRG